MKKPFNLSLALLLGTVVILLIVQVAALFPGITTPIERVEYSSRDLLVKARGQQKPSDDIAIVAIDDFAFSWTGYQWPWPRSYFAEIVDQINKGGGKLVGVDIFLFEPDKDAANDQAFAAALGRMSFAVGVVQVFDNQVQGGSVSTFSQPLTPYLKALDGMGVTVIKRDEDAIVRSVQAYDTYNGKVYYHWAFEIARLYLGVDEPASSSSGRIEFNGQAVPVQGREVLINFAGPAGTYPTYSAANVHDGITLEENPDAFRNKIVLLGATSVTLQDIYPTPFSTQFPTPGVEIVANTIDTLISGKYLTEAPPWMALLLTLAAAFIAFFISRSKRPSVTVILLALVMLAYAVIVAIFFILGRFILPMAAPQIMLFLGVVLPTLEHAVSQEV
ncbi:MAG TPA: CHASE2 domain-containing protein, partial [Anaerolineales bacterium]|nr:CHASE2 domain-containing protein [Anaerolineales bacterium]